MPNPTTPQGLASFLGSRDEFVGATCQARSHVSGEALSLTTDESVTHDEGMKKQRRPKAHSPSQLDLKLASFDHIREPLPFDGFDNHKVNQGHMMFLAIAPNADASCVCPRRTVHLSARDGGNGHCSRARVFLPPSNTPLAAGRRRGHPTHPYGLTQGIWKGAVRVCRCFLSL